MKNNIITYFHCSECIKELSPDTTPKEFQSIQAGFTEEGIQVWCKRHNISVLNVTMEQLKVLHHGIAGHCDCCDK